MNEHKNAERITIIACAVALLAIVDDYQTHQRWQACIHRHPLTSTGAALFLVLLALEAPWWLIVPVAIVLGMRVTKGRDRRKL